MSPTLRVRPRHVLFLAALLAAPACGAPAQRQDTLPDPVAIEAEEPTAAGDEGQGGAVFSPAQPPIMDLAFPDEEFRARQPAAGKPRDFRMPRVQRVKLPSGIDVYLVEQHDLPTISVDLNFDGGEHLDPVGKEGLASVCMDMITEGTRELEKLAFEEALGDLASRVWSYSTEDGQGVAMTTLSKNLDETFALFRASVLEPGMRQEELDRMIARRVQALRQAKFNPQSVALRVSRSVLYGDEHARGRLVTEASLQSITIDDCKAFHQSAIKPKGARLFIVGDMTEKQVRDHFGQGLASWTGAPAAAPRQPKPTAMDGKIFFVDIPGLAQSSVYVMHFGPERKARDYFASSMMSAVLGGGFSSRINMNLREDKGYSYGARAGFNYSREHGVFTMSSSVRSDTTYQSVLEMLSEIEALKTAARPVSKDELEREKNGAILGLPADFATARDALARYRDIVYHRLPLDYYNSYARNVARVDLKQVAQSARQHLRPEQARIIVVGDGSAPLIHRVDGKDEPLERDGKPLTLLEGLRELAASGRLGDTSGVVRLDADGKPLTR